MGSRGFCAPGFVNPYCRGRGFWRSRAFAPRYATAPQMSPVDEMGYLEDAARLLEEDLRSIRERIEALRSRQ